MSKCFEIAHLNVCSLRHKVDHVRILLNVSDIDILCLTETWLDKNIMIVILELMVIKLVDLIEF